MFIRVCKDTYPMGELSNILIFSNNHSNNNNGNTNKNGNIENSNNIIIYYMCPNAC